MCVVLLNFTSACISLYRGRDELVGWESRRTSWLVSVVSGGLAIWVVFAAANPDRHLHLTVTAAKALSVFCIKVSGWITDHLQRRKYSDLWNIGCVRLLYWWKVATLAVALPTATMMEVAVFGCHRATAKNIQTPGTKCYRITAAGAPAEWIYALTTVSWSLSLAFDIYITPIIGQAKSKQDLEEANLLAPDGYSPYSVLSPHDTDFEKADTEASANTDSSRFQTKEHDIFKPTAWEAQSDDSHEDGEAEQDLGLIGKPRDVV
ncbi:hypothetical protein PV08_09355 [Exophiala spinifera]|uniref:Uncharacterized protein n=1 Tax=Exophiala spinifera TaxID=91928 RepID=A0A0D1YB00_9EURO|nr:uncharacterized protein PV08_09355 [Exophiala spinifera]KIW12081.1 hypothetical protein PV08_09355 [Exophiala spinifera]